MALSHAERLYKRQELERKAVRGKAKTETAEVMRLSKIETLSKTAEDGDGNVGKTIKLIAQDKKRT